MGGIEKCKLDENGLQMRADSGADFSHSHDSQLNSKTTKPQPSRHPQHHLRNSLVKNTRTPAIVGVTDSKKFLEDQAKLLLLACRSSWGLTARQSIRCEVVLLNSNANGQSCEGSCLIWAVECASQAKKEILSCL